MADTREKKEETTDQSRIGKYKNRRPVPQNAGRKRSSAGYAGIIAGRKPPDQISNGAPAISRQRVIFLGQEKGV